MARAHNRRAARRDRARASLPHGRPRGARREAGPEPIVSTALLGATAIELGGSAALQREHLPAIVRGKRIVAVWLYARNSTRFSLAAIDTTAEASAGAVWTLNGEKLPRSGRLGGGSPHRVGARRRRCCALRRPREREGRDRVARGARRRPERRKRAARRRRLAPETHVSERAGGDSASSSASSTRAPRASRRRCSARCRRRSR